MWRWAGFAADWHARDIIRQQSDRCGALSGLRCRLLAGAGSCVLKESGECQENGLSFLARDAVEEEATRGGKKKRKERKKEKKN